MFLKGEIVNEKKLRDSSCRLILILAFCLFSAITVGSAWGSDLMQSVAVTDNSIAVYGNPAGLSVTHGPNSLLYFSWDSLNAINKIRGMVAVGNWAVGVNNENGVQSYCVATGSRVLSFLSIGSRFNYTQGNPGIDFGLQYRPFGFLSAGVASNNLISESSQYSVTGGIGVKPFKFLTLSIDQTWAKHKANTLVACGELSINRNLHTYFEFLPDTKSVYFGVSLYGNHTGLGITERKPETSGFVSLSYDIHPVPRLPGIKKIAEIKISGFLRDIQPELNLFGAVHTQTNSIVNRIQRAAKDPGIQGILLSIGNIRAGMGSIEEIRNAILKARLAGKKVVCHLNFIGTGEYYLACAGSEIIIAPESQWFTPGFGYELHLYKGLFEKLGIKADFVVAGKYKGFVEPYKADSLTEDFKRTERKFLDDWHSRMVERIAVARDLPPATVDSLLQHASFQARDAVKAGLADDLCYYSDLPQKVWGKRSKKVNLSYKSFYSESWKMEKKIAVIYLSGTIVPGNSFTDFFSGARFVGSNTMVEMIRHARDDKMVGAIVLRIQSGGGSSLASDIIWHEVEKARKEKPVIVSVGDIAASGAYYIACAADTIVANPGSIVGSIGVYGGKFTFEGLLGKIGIKTEVIKTDEKADAFSVSRPFSEKERRMLKKEINHIYQTFKDRVASGRNLDSASIEAVSEGRIFSGSRAVNNGLADVLGDLSKAVDIAKEKTGIRIKEVQLDFYPKASSLWTNIGKNKYDKAAVRLLNLMTMISRERIWAITPGYMF